MSSAVDRHLLFGLLALRAGLIRKTQLVAAFRGWAADGSRALDDRLIAQGCLDETQREGEREGERGRRRKGTF